MFDIQLLKYKHKHWFYLLLYHIYYKIIDLIINRVQVNGKIPLENMNKGSISLQRKNLNRLFR